MINSINININIKKKNKKLGLVQEKLKIFKYLFYIQEKFNITCNIIN